MGSNDEKKTPDSEAPMFPKGLPGDPTPKQIVAMGGIEMPSDRDAAKAEHMRLTREFNDVYYWVPKPQGWLDKKFGTNDPPNGRSVTDRTMKQCRPWDECGLVIHDSGLWTEACVILRYADHVELIMAVEDLHKGFTFKGNEIRRKFVPVHPGEKDIIGILHKGK